MNFFLFAAFVCLELPFALTEQFSKDEFYWSKPSSFKEMLEYDSTNDLSSLRRIALPLIRRILHQGDILNATEKNYLDSTIEQLKITCDECAAAVSLLHALDSNTGKDLISVVAVEVCILVKIEDRRVCEMAVKEFEPAMIYVVFNLKAKEVCYWLQSDICPKPDGFLPEWKLNATLGPKPPVVPRKRPNPGSPTSKVLFFTDMHMDVQYKAGSNAECGEPLCCRNTDVLQNNSKAAGKWGDYRNCDMPPWTVEGMMKNLSQYQFDFILFTGDIPAHDVWNQSQSDQIDKNNRFTQLILKYFPGTPVYAALGNHAPSPVNLYPPPQLSHLEGGDISWLYEAVANNWKNWLPEEALNTVKKGGFYTTTIRKGLRVVSLNNNYCSDDDWWLLVGNNSVDPLGQLNWFAGIMATAESFGEMVIILSHRPTDGCLHSWSQNYYDIINRYENIIVAQFFGHAHTDELKLFYDTQNTSRVSSVGFIGPGYTTYSYLNAGYRIYTFDGNYENTTHSIIDAASFYLDITEANTKDLPVWRHEYAFLNDYGMKSLFPADFEDLIMRFENDLDFFQKYYHHITKDKDMGYCSSSCRDDKIRGIKKSIAG
ncbi:sphingomyelin phosphodiesterase-like [Styela clava]